MMELLTGPARSAFWEARGHKYEAKLGKLVLDGLLDAYQLSEYHWRVWNVNDPKHAVDYWPRRGTVSINGHVHRNGVRDGFKWLCLVLGVKRQATEPGP